ncbi:hypothetical protein LPJ56_000792 [Coemansia sp. RSA 2599]|nr:hypothetical protein LPJ75_000425 [Coemansia sp. RSA 2598]KAJ1828906.1 hypothetical protein LPJ56_000792 [Coemansia sp. RSA 2599]
MFYNSAQQKGPYGHRQVPTSAAEADRRSEEEGEEESAGLSSHESFEDYVGSRLGALGWADRQQPGRSAASQEMDRSSNGDIPLGAVMAARRGIGAEEGPPEQETVDATSGASMISSFFNLTNAIVGAGVIGLPYAMQQAGLVVGLLLVLFLAFLVDWTLQVLAVNSKLSGRRTYQGLVEHCFGRWGLLANSFFQGAMAGGGMASFIVIVGDTLPHVLGSLFPAAGESSFGRAVFSRRFVVAFFVVCLAYPLSLYRDVGKLGKTSAFAVVAMCTIIVSVIVEGPRIDSALRAEPGSPVVLANTGVFQAMGVITFAFVCHHNSFMIYGSLRKPTLNRYFEVVHISTAIATAASLVIASFGYLYFREKTQGNILNNFPQDNFLINIARFLFALNMITTFPMETLVAREVVDLLCFRDKPFSMKRHVVITTVLCALGLLVGETVCNLGVLLELTGGLSASFLAFILPSACYLRLSSAPLVSRKTLPHWLCIIFGFTVTVLSTDVKIDGPPSIARGYHYDAVFGPKATQEHIYEKIVSPILNEVMQGYNCTIFAYGQTGTGKTYTMEGDLEMQASPSVPSTPGLSRMQTPGVGATDLLNNARISPKAGVIPRTLYNLFYALDKQSAEFYVRVSYVELYNEELRDLLSGADVGGEARGFGGGYESSGSHLKVYESGTDKGVIIQGLEEKIVSSAKEAVALMQAGAMRRKVAATRCNDSSSRSHAIFTITVYIRERAVTAEGEDIVKLGKLNLVDLAGSENIGRSGAQNMRAWEAGNINKSLLVLGRVINALVERNSYVPYRDSKLTYILKDSLGGRTRTCMIATISTSVDNIEETVKTLQYASQAKGIRNRPVANKKVSKSEIVHDMQHQIEQLRRDLEAARDGSGFYVTKESYDEMVADKKIYKDQVDEWRQRVLIYEEQVGQLTRQVAELTRANDGLETRVAETESALMQTRGDLAKTQLLLDNQELLTRAHAFHERSLDGAARLLHGSLETAARDSEQLHRKILRMGEREQQNLLAVEGIGHKVAQETQRAAESIARFAARVDEQTVRLLGSLRQRVGDEFEASVAARLRENVLALQADLDAIAGDAGTQKSGVLQGSAQTLEAIVALVGDLEGGAQRALQRCDEACAGLGRAVQAGLEQQSKALEHMLGSVRSLLETHSGDVKAQGNETRELAAQVVSQMEQETRALEQKHKDEVDELRKQVDELRDHALQSDQAVLATIGEMLGERRTRQEAAMETVVAAARSRAEHTAESAGKMLVQCTSVAGRSDRLVRAVCEGAASASAGVGDCVDAGARESSAMAAQLVETAAAHGRAIRDVAAEMAEGASKARASCSALTGELHQGVESLGVLVESSLEQSQQASKSALQRAADTADQAIGTWRAARDELDALAQTHRGEQQEDSLAVSRHVSGISETVRQEASAGVAATVAGGATPPRRAYDSVDRWCVTQSHEYIVGKLAEFAAGVQPVPETLEWTGVSVLPDDHRPESSSSLSSQHVGSPTAMSEEMQVAGSDTPVSAGSAQTLVVPGAATVDAAVVVKPLRKRTSDTAVSSATDSEMQPPPTRKARTRNSRNTQSSVDMDQEDIEDDAEMDAAPVSGIPRPASRIQAPRRTRRTRG